MGRVRRGIGRSVGSAAITVAVGVAAVTGLAVHAGAATGRSAPTAVATKAKKKKAASACKLLKVAEITQALGTAPTDPPKTDSADECDYSSAAEYNFLNVSITPFVTKALWKQSAQGAGATVAVTGVGDQAFRSPTNNTIIVRKGKKSLRIDQYVSGLPETPIETLAKDAAARL